MIIILSIKQCVNGSLVNTCVSNADALNVLAMLNKMSILLNSITKRLINYTCKTIAQQSKTHNLHVLQNTDKSLLQNNLKKLTIFFSKR